MRKLLLCLFFLFWAGVSLAQTVSTQDNYTGLWTRRSSWQQEWAGISNTNPLPAANITILGYITRGTISANADLALSGSASVLRVNDTLRVHGSLTVSQFATLIVETGGVLIIHGHYNQHDWGRLTLKGKMIVLGDLKLLGSTNATNSGSLYVGGSTSTAGWPLNPKTLSELATEDPVTSYFSTINVIASHCSGSNSGTLTYAGLGGIVRWESSTDYFKSNIQVINNVTTQYTYTNLTKTTSYRVYYNRGGVYGYSNGATVIVEKGSAGGQLSGPVEVCGTGTSSTISLSNHNGTVVRWEWSTSSTFAAGTVQTKVTSEESLTLTDIVEFTYIRAVVKNGNCAEAYSTTHYLKAYPQTNGGSVSGPATVCATANSGALTLGSHRGNVLYWEISRDNFVADIQTINTTEPTLNFSNLNATTWYRAIVKSGPCTQAYSERHKVEVMEVQAGTVSGPATVCSGTNSGTLNLQSYAGTILRWEWSADGFVNDVQTLAHTQSAYTFSNLIADRWYRAVVGVSGCAEKASAVHKVAVDQSSLPGSLAGTSSVCAGDNSGTLTLSAHRGNVLRWESSSDNFVSQVSEIAHTSTSYSFTNLSADTWFRVVVQNGSCAAATSSSFKVSAASMAGGTLTGPNRVCQGSAVSLQLQGYSGSILRWERSTDGFASNLQSISHTQATLTLPSLSETSWFRAVVGNAACGQTFSAVHQVQVDPSSRAGTISGPTSICGGENEGTLVVAGSTGQILRWETSVDNFVADVQQIANTSATHTFTNLSSDRWYRVLVQSGGCAVAVSPSFKITVSQIRAGTLSGSSLLCQGGSGQLELQGYQGQILRWESSADNFATAPQPISHTSATLALTNLTGTRWYRAVVGNAACGEKATASWQVVVEEPSLGGVLSGTEQVCGSSNSGQVRLADHRGEILRWEISTDNFSSNIQPLAHTAATYEFSNLAATSWFRVVVQNGSCALAYSSALQVRVEQSSQGGPVAGAATVCYGNNSGTLTLQSWVGQVLRWESSTDNFATLTEHATTSDNLSYQNLTATTQYRAVIQNGSCAVAYSEVASITVAEPVAAGMVDGDRIVIGGDNAGTLRLMEYKGPILRWEVSTDNFASNIQPIATTTDVLEYQNISSTSWYRAVIDNGSCSPVFSVAAKVRVNRAPVAQKDVLQVTVADYQSVSSVLQNDTDPDGDALQAQALQITTAAGGTASLRADGVLTYQPPANYLGLDSLTYTVCDLVPEASLCDEALIVLDVRLPLPGLVVYQGVSPNGDGQNDFWFIEYIERYPENFVQLYDRYGTLVFELAGYDNQTKIFAGLANRGIRPGGDPLPEGTYFYKISTSASAQVLKGYIVLKK